MTYVDVITTFLQPTGMPAWNTPAAALAVRVFNRKVTVQDNIPGIA